MTRRMVVNFIRNTNGRTFAVEFIKRTTGELRLMNCRTGVKKHLKGGTQPYDPKAYNLLTVFDMVSGGYRTIPIDGITRIKVNGIWHEVK